MGRASCGTSSSEGAKRNNLCTWCKMNAGNPLLVLLEPEALADWDLVTTTYNMQRRREIGTNENEDKLDSLSLKENQTVNRVGHNDLGSGVSTIKTMNITNSKRWPSVPA